MISVIGKKWKEYLPNKNLVEKLKQDHSFSDILSKLIISRKFDQITSHSSFSNKIISEDNIDTQKNAA